MNSLPKLLRWAIGIGYIILGVYAFINSNLFPAFPPVVTQVFGGLCIVYGIFRIWRISRES